MYLVDLHLVVGELSDQFALKLGNQADAHLLGCAVLADHSLVLVVGLHGAQHQLGNLLHARVQTRLLVRAVVLQRSRLHNHNAHSE